MNITKENRNSKNRSENSKIIDTYCEESFQLSVATNLNTNVDRLLEGCSFRGLVYRVTYTQKELNPRSNGWKFERLGKNVSGVTARLFSALTTVPCEITCPAMKWPTNKHCDKSERVVARHAVTVNTMSPPSYDVELLSMADSRYEKFEKRRNWTSICGINPRRVSILPFERNGVSKRDFDYRPSTRMFRIRLRHYIHFDTFFDIFISPISNVYIWSQVSYLSIATLPMVTYMK